MNATSGSSDEAPLGLSSFASRAAVLDGAEPHPPATLSPPPAVTRPGGRAVAGRRALAGDRTWDAAAIGLLALLTAVFAWHRLWVWNGLAYLDIATFYLPWYSYLGEHLRALDIPGWNPYQLSGSPFAADPQSGWWYLPAMGFFAVLPPIAAYKAMLVFHLLLAGVGTFGLGRLLGMRRAGALAAALAYEFGPFANHISSNLIHIQVAAWIPVGLAGVELAARRADSARQLMGWSIAACAVSQMLAGWVGQGAYNGLLVVGSFLAYRTLFSPHHPSGLWTRIRNACAGGLAVFGLGLGLGAAGLLPRLAAIGATNVAGGEYVGEGAVNYAEGWTFQLLLDRLLSDGGNYFSFLFYLGGATVALAVLALPLSGRRLGAPYFAGLTAVVTVLTLERITPVHRLFYLLPGFEVLHEHVPTRVVVAQWIGVAILAGVTVDRVATRQIPSRRLVWGMVALPAVAVLTYLWTVHRVIGLATILALCIVVVLMLSLHWRRAEASPALRGAIAALLVVMIVWEPAGQYTAGALLFDGGNPVLDLPTGPVSRGDVAANIASTDPGGAGEFLQERLRIEGPFRFFGYDDALQEPVFGWPSTYREWYFAEEAQALLVNARAMRLGLYDVQGYNPVQLTSYVRFLEVLNGGPQNYHDAQVLPGGLTSPLLNLLNVRYIVVPAAIPRDRPDLRGLVTTYEEVFRNEKVRVLRNPDAMPRAWIVHETRAIDPDRQAAALASGSIDPERVALLDDGVTVATESPPPGAREWVTVTSLGDDEIRLSARLASDGVVVLSESFAEGWRATVDGERVPVYRANGALRAIPVPAGAASIVLTYAPPLLWVGLGVSGASAGAILAGWAVLGWRRRTDGSTLTLPSPNHGRGFYGIRYRSSAAIWRRARRL